VIAELTQQQLPLFDYKDDASTSLSYARK